MQVQDQVRLVDLNKSKERYLFEGGRHSNMKTSLEGHVPSGRSMGRGFVVSSWLCGLLSSAVLLPLLPGLEPTPLLWSFDRPQATAWLLLSLPLINCVWLGRLFYRSRQLFRIGQVFGLSYMASVLLLGLAWQPAGVFLVGWNEWLNGILLIGLVSTICGGASLLFGRPNLAGRSVPFAEDPSVCSRCAYPLTEARSTVCPECGGKSNSMSKLFETRRRCVLWMARWGIVPLFAALCVGLGALALGVWREWPYQQFMKTFGGSGSLFIETRAGARRAVCAFRSLHNDPSRAIVLCFTRQGGWGSGVIQLRLGSLRPGDWGPMDGSIRIVCNLTACESRHVLEHDVPPSLIDALLDAAEGAKWSPEGSSFFAAQEIRILGQGHFPSCR